MKTRYVFTMGTLSKKDHSLIFKNKTTTTKIPINNTREIFIMNEVTVNSKLFDELTKYNIILYFFNYHGNYIGTFYPKEYLRSGKLMVKQVELFLSNRETVARQFVLGMSRNIHTTLYHYYKHGKKEIKEFLDWLKKDVPRLLETAETINQIMMVEGMMWKGFYDTFKFILPADFVMNKRVKRPPDNPINALISFGNTLLYAKTITQIYHTQLSQEISYLHSPSEARFSLSLDIAEIFKPVIVYKTIFDLVNNRKLRVEDHFDRELNYCMLNEEGRKIFVAAFEERLGKTFKHTKLKRNISYQTAIKYEGYKLIKMMVEGEMYEPFNEKEKM